MSTRQYNRTASVIVGKGGNGILIEGLRIVFEVTKTSEETPNQATIKIYNLAEDTYSQLKKEYTDILLKVGYQGNALVVFKGNIISAPTYWEGVDNITEIKAGDGDSDYRNAVVNETLAAGTSDKELVEKASASMTGGTTLGYSDAGQVARTRGKVITGDTRKVLAKVAKQNACTWSIQDGVLQMVKVTGVLPDEAIVLNYNTGLIDSPKRSEEGLEVKALLNPTFKIDGKIKINNKEVDARLPDSNEKSKDKKPLPALSSDGFYKLIKVTHTGDTHGQDWYSNLVGVPL